MYLGADLSYVNEMEADGGLYYDSGQAADPFHILKNYGANIVRVRLWHTPTWTAYSNFDDVQRTIRRAKDTGMATLLDFHYSDTWADPGKQIIPAAWADMADLEQLEAAMYDYTLQTLIELDQKGLMPEFAQVGNEINTEILMPGHYNGEAIRWPRNARLINAGIRGVRAAGKQGSVQPQVMLHIAQPENLLPWFDAAIEAGVNDFDWIGMSYYSKWSTRSVAQAGETMGEAIRCYGKGLMVVETAYPWTLNGGKSESHLLGEDAITPDYPPTPEGQYNFLADLKRATADNGGAGVIYWEPAWISTPSKPSIWENATVFDHNGAAHKGIEFLSQG
jgi:arabinogalactan endo-1,4-beta-galactosidase